MNLAERNLIIMLQAQKQLGRTAAQAMTALAQDGFDRRELSAATLAANLNEVYAGAITALEIAIILRELFYSLDEIVTALYATFPSLAPLDSGAILLSPQVCPGTPRPALVTALEQAGYAAGATALAANILFPVLFKVQSTRPWQRTGVILSGTQNTTIAYQGGAWSADPERGSCTGAGIAGLPAKCLYTLEGAPEGALIGRIGATTFLAGDHGLAPAGLAGELELCINDDLEEHYGRGLKDNQGSLTVKVSTTAS